MKKEKPEKNDSETSSQSRRVSDISGEEVSTQGTKSSITHDFEKSKELIDHLEREIKAMGKINFESKEQIIKL